MARILIWMSPEPGHILPTLKFARDLRMRGHTVIYHTCLGLHEELIGLGFECHPLLRGECESFGPRGLYSTTQSSKDWYDAMVAHFQDDRVRAYGAISDDITEAAIAAGADLVLIDSLMSYLYGIKVDCSRKPDLRVGYVQTNLPLVVLGTNMARSPRMLLRADRTIILCPKELEIPGFIIESGHYAEASIHLNRGPAHFPWEWLDSSRKLIYCGLGSQSSLYPEAIDFLRALVAVASRMPEHQFVISAGPCAQDLEVIAASLPNCKVFAGVPQTGILERAAAMILQGGLGSIKECLYFGVPMLVAPFVNDQPLNAARVCQHGLGRSIPPRAANVEDLCGAIHMLLDDRETLTRVRRMQAVFQAREREMIAASICERLLQPEPACSGAARSA